MKPERWQQIKGLYESALRYDEGKRASFLEQACDGDSELRREVESLLAHHDGNDSFIETPAVELAARALAERPAESLLGRQLGSYKVLSLLGAGGMGDVYRAKDGKLGREVALKVLPELFAHDPERLQRFQREALLLASLNHPNIAAIHGLEETDGVRYLVLELVAGETLAERVAAGPLEVKEALGICGQIAEGLEAAHEKGIIHRDLKPANIKVTPDGMVKVLDFGLGKASAGAGRERSHSPTATGAGTGEGAILGTTAYMSPEQARGKPLDRRTDIWSFGCVVYEALTGRKAFAAETVSDTIATLLGREPDWAALPQTTPASIRILLHRCLEKEPRRRLHDIADARIEIDDALAAPEPLVAPAGTVGGEVRRGWSPTLAWGLTCLVVAAITGFAVWNLRPPLRPAPEPVSRFTFALSPDERLAAAEQLPALALSPHGTHLVYAANRGGSQQLYLRALDQLESRPMPGTEGGFGPFFSPDGQWVGFFSDFKLKKVAIGGGATSTLCDVSSPTGASWGPDDTILFTQVYSPGLMRVSAAGGVPQVLTLPDSKKGEHSFNSPTFLPGGKSILLSLSEGEPRALHIAVQSLETGARQVLVRGPASRPRYVPTGHILYYRGAGSLLAVPFDLERLRVTGSPALIMEGVTAQFATSRSGTMVYVPPEAQSLVWVDRKGMPRPVGAPRKAYAGPRLSPDGRRLAVGIAGDRGFIDVWTYDLDRGTTTRLTFEGGVLPTWTPDGKWVTFSARGVWNLFRVAADGSGNRERLTTSDLRHMFSSWSPDGQLLAFDERPPSNSDIWILSVREERKPQPFLRTPFIEAAPTFSPDGRLLAYVSNESGRFEVYVQTFPGPGGRWPISTEGGSEPVWARNGRELFYRNGGKMMVVDITTPPGFGAGAPRLLFEGPYARGAWTPNYDIAPDGQRFLMVESPPAQIHVVLNWFEELKRRAGAAGR